MDRGLILGIVTIIVIITVSGCLADQSKTEFAEPDKSYSITKIDSSNQSNGLSGVFVNNDGIEIYGNFELNGSDSSVSGVKAINWNGSVTERKRFGNIFFKSIRPGNPPQDLFAENRYAFVAANGSYSRITKPSLLVKIETGDIVDIKSLNTNINAIEYRSGNLTIATSPTTDDKYTIRRKNNGGWQNGTFSPFQSPGFEPEYGPENLTPSIVTEDEDRVYLIFSRPGGHPTLPAQGPSAGVRTLDKRLTPQWNLTVNATMNAEWSTQIHSTYSTGDSIVLVGNGATGPMALSVNTSTGATEWSRVWEDLRPDAVEGGIHDLTRLSGGVYVMAGRIKDENANDTLAVLRVSSSGTVTGRYFERIGSDFTILDVSKVQDSLKIIGYSESRPIDFGSDPQEPQPDTGLNVWVLEFDLDDLTHQ